jgi:hypothetical protein
VLLARGFDDLSAQQIATNPKRSPNNWMRSGQGHRPCASADFRRGAPGDRGRRYDALVRRNAELEAAFRI